MKRFEVYGQRNDGEEDEHPIAIFLNVYDARQYALEKRGKIAYGIPAVYCVEEKEIRTRIKVDK